MLRNSHKRRNSCRSDWQRCLFASRQLFLLNLARKYAQTFWTWTTTQQSGPWSNRKSLASLSLEKDWPECRLACLFCRQLSLWLQQACYGTHCCFCQCLRNWVMAALATSCSGSLQCPCWKAIRFGFASNCQLGRDGKDWTTLGHGEKEKTVGFQSPAQTSILLQHVTAFLFPFPHLALASSLCFPPRPAVSAHKLWVQTEYGWSYLEPFQCA